MAERLRIPYAPPGAAEIRRALIERARRVDEQLEDPAVRARLDAALDEAAGTPPATP